MYVCCISYIVKKCYMYIYTYTYVTFPFVFSGR